MQLETDVWLANLPDDQISHESSNTSDDDSTTARHKTMDQMIEDIEDEEAEENDSPDQFVTQSVLKGQESLQPDIIGEDKSTFIPQSNEERHLNVIRNAMLAGPLLIVAFEAVVTARDVVLADQVVYTLSAFLAIIVIAKVDASFMIRVEHAAAWLLFRVLRLSTKGGASAESRWRAAQIMLIVVILVHYMRRFARRAPRGSPAHAIVYDAGARLETQLSGSLILMVALTYADRDVLPLHINVWGIVLPLAYTICVTVPHEKRIKLKLVPTTAFAKLAEGVVCLGVLYIIGLCFMYTRSTVLTGTPADPCNPLLTNLHTCANGEQGTYVFGTCCREKTHMLVPEANWARVLPLRTAPVQECQVALSRLTFRDCCNNIRAEATDGLLAGPKACLCNSNVAGNTYSTVTSACVCNGNYTGFACHLPVL